MAAHQSEGPIRTAPSVLSSNYELRQTKVTTTRNENVRTDKVTNSRPGIELYKTDWEGTNLQGAVFTLKDSDGKDVAASKYTSDETGLITIAYLNAGTYTLQETEVPKGYTVLDHPITITSMKMKKLPYR